MSVNKYSRSRDKIRPHGFPLDSPWDNFFSYLAPRDLFIWFREIVQDLPNGFVKIKNAGEMLMLGGYSYLGLNCHPEIKEACSEAIQRYGSGTHGSRWLAGHTSLHHELEELLAEIHGTEDAIVYSSGYVSNVSTFSALLNRNDTVYSDELNHASIIDGCRSCGAAIKIFRYNDPDDLKKQIKENSLSGRRMVAIDGIYSMTGDICNVPEFVSVCQEYDAALFIDECHSHFVLGKNGGGVKEFFKLSESDIDIEMGTLSKAIPSDGGYIVGSADMITFLRRASRGFIYSGSTSAVMISAAITGLKLFKRNRKLLISNLTENTQFFRTAIENKGLQLIGGGHTPIVPIFVGPAIAAARAAA